MDSSIVAERTMRDDVTVHYIPATQMALELGLAMVSNLILLSAYLEATKALPIEAIEKALKDRYTGTKGERFQLGNKDGIFRLSQHRIFFK